MKKHLIVFFCYELIDIHNKAFDNIISLDADFFIVENPSINSEKIKNYFINHRDSHKIIRYIRYNYNTANIGTFVLKHFYDLLLEYEFVTFTDGDLVYDDPISLDKEVKKNLSYPNVVVSASDLKLDNLPKVPNSENWIPIGKYIPEFDYIECPTGISYMTLLSTNLKIIKQVQFLDHVMYSHIASFGKKWVKTSKNKAYHLTWDLYYEGNPYYEYKKNLNWNFNLNYDAFVTIL